MPRSVACANCRQHKLRCDASTAAPAPCTRCRTREIQCSIDANFKRTSTRNRVQQLTQQVQELTKCLNNSVNATPPSPASDRTAVTYGYEGARKESLPGPGQDGYAQLGEILLHRCEILALFQEYLDRFHPLFPVLDPAADILRIREDCPSLFWSIMTTAAKSLRPTLYQPLCKLIPSLISGSFFFRTYSLQPCQALLILCMWPLPHDKSREDVRWIYSGIAMQMSTVNGLHKIDSNHEYGKADALHVNERDQRELNRTWYCCCYVNSILSCELGLPAAFDLESMRAQKLIEDVLPWSMLCSVKISLESSRINRVIDHTFSKQSFTTDAATRLGLLRMLEVDLDNLVSSLRAHGRNLDTAFELSVLTAKLNLYSSGLNQATKLTLPEATQLRMSAFTCATKYVDLLLQIPLIPESEEEQARSLYALHSSYPRTYWKTLFYACLVLIKLGLTNSLPEVQIDQSKRTVQQAYEFLLACSNGGKDQLWRAARLIHLLRQQAIQELVKPRHEVHSRMGASIMYELILSLASWRKQREAEERRELRNLWGNSEQVSEVIPGNLGESEMPRQNFDDWFVDSNTIGVMGFDMNIWNSSMFEEVSLAMPQNFDR